MACGLALKRPHDFDAYLAAEANGPSEAKRARPMHCSPFRPQLGTIAASLPSGCVAKLKDDSSSFIAAGERCQMNTAQIESYLKAEVRYLRRRRLVPRRALGEESESKGEAEGVARAGEKRRIIDGEDVSVAGGNYRAPKSPTQSGSDSEGECSSSSRRPSTSQTDRQDVVRALNEKPMFSLKQVQMIVERLLKEQEVRLRYEYESVLNKRLDEQHAQYVQFAQEQLNSHSTASEQTDFSYLS